MTAREAIARFEPYIWNECYRKEFQEACSHAISALQEREERSNGCEYCKEYDSVDDAPMLACEEYYSDVGMYLCNGYLCSNSGEGIELKINFCPMCGRPLKGADNGKAD